MPGEKPKNPAFIVNFSDDAVEFLYDDIMTGGRSPHEFIEWALKVGMHARMLDMTGSKVKFHHDDFSIQVLDTSRGSE